MVAPILPERRLVNVDARGGCTPPRGPRETAVFACRAEEHVLDPQGPSDADGGATVHVDLAAVAPSPLPLRSFRDW
jgi:hypothetical protein